MSDVITHTNEHADNDHHQHDHTQGRNRFMAFIIRWVCSTNHKDIGTLYLVLSGLMFFIGGIMAMLIRTELFKPGYLILNPDLFNQMTTLHGLIMVFGVVMPAFVGLANWMVP